MRIFMMLAAILVAGAASYADDGDQPQNGLWRYSSCSNPFLSYRVRQSSTPGAVTVIFDIDKQGYVRNIRVKDAKASGGMASYARQAIGRWRYFAYLVDGKETARKDVSLTFTYSKDGPPTCSHSVLPGVVAQEGNPQDPLYGLNVCSIVDYPEWAIRKKMQGIVQLGFDITEQGDVTNIVLANPTPYATLNKSAIKTLNRWRFYPFTHDGKAMARRGLTVKFYYGVPSPKGQAMQDCLVARSSEGLQTAAR